MAKAIFIFLLALGLGVGAGYGYFMMETSGSNEPFHENAWADTKSKGDNFGASIDRASQILNVGEMKANKIYEDKFEFTNQGRSQLRMWIPSDPPDEVAIDLTKEQTLEVDKDETMPLKVFVTPTEHESDFRKMVVLSTNDPYNSRVELTIIGQVWGGVFVDKKVTQISRAKLEASNEFVVNLYSTEHDDIEISETVFARPKEAKWFEVDIQPMDSDQMSSVAGAKSGKTVTITVSRELPRNIRQQFLTLSTNADGYEPIELNLFIAQ